MLPWPGVLPVGVAVLFGLFMSQYVVVLAHELGHAVWALRKTDQPVYVLVGGARDGDPVRRIGRLYVAVGTNGGGGKMVCTRAQMGPRDQLICAVLGPLSALAISIALVGVSLLSRSLPFIAWLVGTMAAVGLWSALSDLVPRRTSNGVSDGWVISDVARGNSGIPPKRSRSP